MMRVWLPTAGALFRVEKVRRHAKTSRPSRKSSQHNFLCRWEVGASCQFDSRTAQQTRLQEYPCWEGETQNTFLFVKLTEKQTQTPQIKRPKTKMSWDVMETLLSCNLNS